MKVIKDLADTLANSTNDCFVCIVNETNTSIQLIMKSNSRVHAGNTLKSVVFLFDGYGGGSNSFAQGGIKELVDITLIKDELVNLYKRQNVNVSIYPFSQLSFVFYILSSLRAHLTAAKSPETPFGCLRAVLF